MAITYVYLTVDVAKQIFLLNKIYSYDNHAAKLKIGRHRWNEFEK